MINLNLQDVDLLRDQFTQALPVPYVVIDGLFADAETLSNAFPDSEWPHWVSLGSEYEANKFSCRDLSIFPNVIREAVVQLTQAPFLKFLESITGIEALIPDPHLEGGGLHLSTEGGILAPHTDFHIYKRLNLYRQINLILYLNDSWRSGDGGTLRLWDGSTKERESPEARVDPVLGRTIIFKTDDKSVHGFTEPVGPGKLRKSVALYYYTAVDYSSFGGDFTTFWRHERDELRSRSTRLILYRFLLEVSRAFSFLAHLVNPRLGRRWWRARRGQREY